MVSKALGDSRNRPIAYFLSSVISNIDPTTSMIYKLVEWFFIKQNNCHFGIYNQWEDHTTVYTVYAICWKSIVIWK